MLSFEWPWLLLLLPLPWFYRRWRKAKEMHTPALKAAVFTALTEQASSDSPQQRQRLLLAILTACWICTLIAVARPTWIGDPVALPATGRDLLIAVDISGSMKKNQDMLLNGDYVDRLTAVKAILGDFVQQRDGDRLGLILFGSQPYLQTPLTFDRTTVHTLLQEAEVGMAGMETAIGDAIGLAVKRLQDHPENSRVLILLTDGANTSGEVKPLEAAEIATKRGIKIHTIGIGAEELYERRLFITRKTNPSKDLDEATLTSIAEQTGGQYFRARNPDELSEIYRHLNALEPIDQEAETLRPTKALFHWPLAIALLGSLLLPYINARSGVS